MKVPTIPIDISAVIQEAIDVEAASKIPLSISVLIDDTAPSDLAAFVRGAFASTAAQARVSQNYFYDETAIFDARCDMAVVVAAATPQVGQVVDSVRAAGVPCMVVTTSPEQVQACAKEAGFPIPEADLIAPVLQDGDVVSLAHPIVVSSQQLEEDGPKAADPGFDLVTLEPIALTDQVVEGLSLRIGQWVVDTFKTKRLAFAQAFAFVRRPLANAAIITSSLQNAGVGAVMFIPGADMPVMTLNQAKMVLQIAAAYGNQMTVERARELAAVVAGGFACRAVARQLVGVVPVLGWAIKAAVGFTGTQAMGRAALEYFEGGGNAAGVVNVVAKARNSVIAAAEKTPAGRVVASTVHDVAEKAKGAAAEKAKDTLRQTPGRVVGMAKGAVSTVAGAAAGALSKERDLNQAQNQDQIRV